MPICALARRKTVVESRRRCSGRLWIVGFWKARESAIFELFKSVVFKLFSSRHPESDQKDSAAHPSEFR
jgi:hypothetical protein